MLNANLRLRYIHHGDFRCNEATLLDQALAEAKVHGVELAELGPNDCILAVSAGGKLVRFLFGFAEHKTLDSRGQSNGRSTRVLPSLQYRILDNGTFNGYMIAHYAAALGIKLDRIQKLEEHLRRQELAKQGGR